MGVALFAENCACGQGGSAMWGGDTGIKKREKERESDIESVCERASVCERETGKEREREREQEREGEYVRKRDREGERVSM